jgi:hypothetical protein
MGKKAQLIAEISSEMVQFNKLCGTIGEDLQSFPPFVPGPLSHNQGPYWDRYLRDTKPISEKISADWEALQSCYRKASSAINKLQKKLSAQKANWFKRFTKGYKNATDFCAQAKKDLLNMESTVVTVEEIISDPQKAPQGLTEYFRRRW